MTPYWTSADGRHVVYHGDSLEVLPTLEKGSVDAVITDPPYPCINREYGVWTEAEWFALMRCIVPECMRVLKLAGSAVFILQPNSERVGRMRTWLWEFMAWVGKEYGIVQDVWWWNPSSPPTIHVNRDRGGLRPSVKACVWLGGSECYKNQDAVLWTESDANAAQRKCSRALQYKPSGLSMRVGRCTAAAVERGGVTPFNLLPIPNANSTDSAGSHGHGAGTPLPLCSWWVRYICPEGGTVLDPFLGSGTVGLAALKWGQRFVGVEQEEKYAEIAVRRLEAELSRPLLPFEPVEPAPVQAELFGGNEP